MNTEKELTQEEKDEKIKVLYIQKTALLDKYGVFGGGREVDQMHEHINRQLEALGVKP